MNVDLSDFEQKIKVRPLRMSDFEDVVSLQRSCFPRMEPWTRDHFQSQLNIFPEGQICVEFEGKIVASSSSLILDFDLYSDWHDWRRISDDGYIRNHDPGGDVLYGIEIMVHPEYRGRKLARRLYEARKHLVRTRNLKGIVIGGRIPGYQAYQDEMDASEYVEKVQEKSIYDPVLTAQNANGFRLVELIPEYLPSDEDSAGWATHMQWINVDYRPDRKRDIRPVQMVRLAAVQYKMRPVTDFDQFVKQVEFFVDTGSEYRCDFILFPELLTTQLLSFSKSGRPAVAARRLAGYLPRYLDTFTDMAVRYHVNIVGGSTFVIEDDRLYNVAYLFRRNGTIERQVKLHITPSEWKWWGVRGGEKMEVFDTDCGRVAIMICYDVEFPELARIAAKKGAHILFVPFNTHERSGYLRVRHCAMARCVENHMYAVLAGATGNLPQVDNADIHYAQSGIFTPADISFTWNAVAAECTANIETLVMLDLDIEMLRRHRYSGTTQNWKDRRRDLYELRYLPGDLRI